jgi:ABC-type nickel/cobalt efflux system permease component RcnA
MIITLWILIVTFISIGIFLTSCSLKLLLKGSFNDGKRMTQNERCGCAFLAIVGILITVIVFYLGIILIAKK